MANLVLNIGTSKDTDADSPNYEVWRDVSIESKADAIGGYDIEKLINVKAVQNGIRQCFTWMQGERVLLPEFGSKLNLYLYEGITNYNVEQIMAEIRGCVQKWEPRASIQSVVNASTTDDTENNTVVLDIVYTIPDLTDEQYRYTYVYHKSSI